MTPSPLDVYERVLHRAEPLLAHVDGGEPVALPVERWLGGETLGDQALLEHVRAPVLDVGCGPGRHVAALWRRGVPTLGLDLSPVAIRLARARGAPVWRGSVFDPVPGAGTWRTALLLDGNVGIGGRPGVLLRRVGEVLAGNGRALAELAPPGSATRALRMRLQGGGELSRPFPWAVLGVDDAGAVARDAGFALEATWSAHGRWFADLRRR